MRSIGFKLWIVLISLVVFILLLLWFFQVIFLENFYINSRVNDVKDSIVSLSKSATLKTETEIYNELEKIAYDNNLYIEIIDSGRNVVFVTETSQGNSIPPMVRNTARISAMEKALSGNQTISSLTHPRFNTEFFLIGMPFSLKEGFVSALLISMPIAPVKDTTSILKEQLVYISIILLLTALFITFFISRSLTKPILQIKETAEKIARGDFNSRLDIKRKDEIGILAYTINNMSSELSKIDSLRRELIANVSHELRTPLSLIQGYAETVRDVTWNNDKKRENALNTIVEESKRLGIIVNDILNLSQLETNNFELEYVNFSLNDLIQSIFNKYELLKEKMQLELILDIHDDIMVWADPPKIEQVFYNLINNAFNHTPEGGKITVKAFTKGDLIKISVSDTGSGISPESLKHIWDRFYKAPKDNPGKLPATGLGLAIVKNILNAHHSTFGVESQEGSGTTFWFTLKQVSSFHK